MAVIRDYYYGATHIIICDDYAVPKEDIPKILEKIGEDAYRAISAAMEKEGVSGTNKSGK